MIPGRWREALHRSRRDGLAWWEIAVLAAGIATATVAVVLTLRADFLAYPGWLAAQKADLILGPIAVGLYWRRRRPQSSFGPMLVALGFVHMPYILQSSSNPTLFTIAGYWGEVAIYLATLAIILAFPTGRLRWPSDGVVLAGAAVFAVGPAVALTMFTKQVFATGAISTCRPACPEIVGAVSVSPSVVSRLVDVARWGIVGVALAIAALLLWRFATGTRPQRRALAIGMPIALLFLLTQACFQLTMAFGGEELALNTYVRWLFTIARSALWWGFLIALVAAELFAARVLRRIVTESLRRPSLRELETLLREPLGDPRLQLAFPQPRTGRWVDGAGETVQASPPESGRTLTEIGLDGSPAAAIVHDAQLADDPELLQAAGATALLARENAELQAGWTASLRELQTSRARLVAASARERRGLEQDLHDGAQQALVALGVKLALAADQVADPGLHRQLSELGDELDSAIDELRDLAHGIYPSLLSDLGLVYSLKSVAHHSGRSVEVTGDGVDRYSVEIESALYYCCREALQNAIRHAGPGARIAIHLRDSGDRLSFEVRDDGDGFDTGARRTGDGLDNMEDRIGALDGSIRFASAPGQGTVVSGAVPLGR
jgi:signal transduction histidine kinase